MGLLSSILAVYLSESGHILRLPPDQKYKVVEPLWMLVKTHEGKESIEDLIIDLEPSISL